MNSLILLLELKNSDDYLTNFIRMAQPGGGARWYGGAGLGSGLCGA